METLYSVTGFLGIVFGLVFLLVAATSKFPYYRHNPSLYCSGTIAFVGGIFLILWRF